MRLHPFITAITLLFGTAQAQTPLTGSTGVPTTEKPPLSGAALPSDGAAPNGNLHRGHRKLQERFDAANSTHDGHLTLEQARAGMPFVARDFDEIDTDHKGYLTLDQIREHNRAKRQARHAAPAH